MAASGKPHIDTVLITGASSGIGEALARRFAKAGHPLVLVARSKSKLDALAKSLAVEYDLRVWVRTADLARPGAAHALGAELKHKRIRVDVLVNNAGVMHQGTFTSMSARQHRQLIDLNVAGLTGMLVEFLPPMCARGHGRVLNVASIAAFQPVPRLATYAATKAFVLSLTESLAEELRNSGVTVTALCPGITDTHMLTSAIKANGRLSKLPGLLVGSAAEVAEAGYRACMRGVVVAVPGAVNQAMTLASRAAPGWLVRRVAGAIVRTGA